MAEFAALTDRWIKQNEIEMYRTAYLASVLINIHRNPKKPPIKPEDLLGGRGAAHEKLSTSADELKAILTALSRNSKRV